MALVLMLAPSFALANLAHGFITTANFGSVNMRADTSVNSEKVGSIPYGTQIIILEYLKDNSWVLVDYNGLQGYVMTRYISYSNQERPVKPPTPSKPAPKPAPAAEDLTHIFHGFESADYTAVLKATAPGGFVHMRWAPSKQMPIMADYFDGKQFEVVSENNSWCQIRDAETGKIGFMMRSFLSPIAPY